MADVDYGTDVRALTDVDDPEVLVSGETNLAYALARRLLQDDTALGEIGDDEECDTLDLRDYLGDSVDAADLRALEARCTSILASDPRVESVTVLVSFSDGVLTVEVDVQGVDGPFSFVIKVDDVDVTVLVGE